MPLQHVRSASVAASLVAMMGCATYRPQPLDPATELAALAHREISVLTSADATHLPIPAQPMRGLGEGDLVSAALRLNPDLAVKRETLGQSDALLIEAGLWPNPELGFAVRGGPPGVTASADLLAALLRPGERKARTGAAQAATRAARAGLVADEWALVAQVRHARMDVLAAEVLRLAAADASALSQRASLLMTKKKSLGEASDLESANAAWELAETQRVEREVAAQVARSRRRLNQLCGLPADVVLELAGFGQPVAITDVQAPTPSEMDGVVLVGRWELAESKAAYERAEDELRLAIAKQYPALKIGPSASRDGGTTVGIGISLDIPLFDRNQGGIRAAESHRDEVRAAYVAQLHRLLAEAHDAGAELTRTRAEVASLDADLMPAASRAMDLADRALTARELSFTDYLISRRQWLAAQRLRLDAVSAFGHAVISLDAALGRGADGLPRPIGNELPTGPDHPQEGSP
jgi:cobalt-zinc-cadmium efflux system outer membrane protein